MKIIQTKTYYAPTFLDFSRDRRKKKTGDLKATIFTRTFTLLERKNGSRFVRAERGARFPSWDKDTEAAKAHAIAEAIEGMDELELLEENPPLEFIPDEIEALLAL